MKKIVIAIAVILLIIIGALVAVANSGSSSRTFSPAEFPETMSLAPADEALTFARVMIEDKHHVIAVMSCGKNSIQGYDLSTHFEDFESDPIALFNEYGYDVIQQAMADGPSDSVATISIDALAMPIDLTDAHIAAGTNFAAHAEESEVEDGPFLFAKLVTPTVSGSEVSAGDALLDYEVELAFVTLEDAPLPDVPETMGLILANEVTDRATLIRHLDPDDVTSGDGFTTGKSAPGYLPVGNFFVIPRDFRAFVAETNIALAVNGELRQDAPMTLAIWDVDEIFRQVKARENTQWEHRGEMIGLPIVDGAIPARTLVLAGTPAGTAFNGIGTNHMAAGVLRMLTGGGFSITDNVIEAYIKKARNDSAFLKPGDEVEIQSQRLGWVRSTVVE